MAEQVKKTHVSIGFLAHVGASKRAPRFNRLIPGSKAGDFVHRGLVA